MLAIFDGSVAKRPYSNMLPHQEAVSALKDDFLINYFISIHPDSVIVNSQASFTFAYSLKSSSPSPSPSPSPPALPRFQFAHKDSIFCMYQGHMEEIDELMRAYRLNKIDSEANVIARAFHILRQQGRRTPKKVVQDMSGSLTSILYESPSKFLLVTCESSEDLRLFWGIDARFCLVLSDDETIVKKACQSLRPFPGGKVYISCEGRTGLQALFMSKPPQIKLNLVDSNTLIKESIDCAIRKILQACKNRSRSSVEKWRPPGTDLVKINTDAVVFSDGTFGIGVIIRNSKGETLAAISRNHKVQSAIGRVYPEGLALIDGLHLARRHGFGRCISESVGLDFGMIQQQIVWLNLVGDIAGLMKDCSEFSLSFVSRSANRAARGLAECGKVIQYAEWKRETPQFISNIVLSECPRQ